MPRKPRLEMSKTFPLSSGGWKKRMKLLALCRQRRSDRRLDAHRSAFYRFRLDAFYYSHQPGRRFFRSRVAETTGLVWRAWSQGDDAFYARVSILHLKIFDQAPSGYLKASLSRN